MNLFNLFRPRTSAPVARERLQIILSHERSGRSDLLAILREEILAAVAKHVIADRDSIQVRMDRGETISSLEISVEIPQPDHLSFARASTHGSQRRMVVVAECNNLGERYTRKNVLFLRGGESPTFPRMFSSSALFLHREG